MNQEAAPATDHRFLAFLLHCPRYQFHGTSRFARDARLAPSTVSRVLHGKHQPRYTTILRMWRTLEGALNRQIDLHELIIEAGESFPTTYPCAAVGCAGCIPDCFYTTEGALKERYADATPGAWVWTDGQ